MHTVSRPDDTPDEATIQAVTQQAVQQYLGQPGNLLPILHAIQNALGYIPPTAVPLIGEAIQLSRAEIHGVISFYPDFRQKPAGKVVLKLCRAEACQSMGANQLADYARRQLNCEFHETSSTRSVTLQPVFCLGLCAQSPAVMVNNQPHARVTPEKLDELLASQGV